MFRNFPVAENPIDKREGGEYQGYPSKGTRLPVPKFLMKESFSVSLSSSIKKR